MSDSNEERLVLDKKHAKTPFFVYLVAILSAVGGLLFGYDTGVVSGAMILLRSRFKLSDIMQGIVVSITIIAAWLFSLVGSKLADRFGRKYVIILASLVFTVGSILMGFAHNIDVLIIGRAVVGIGIGLASMCVPMYIAEIAPQDIRGILVTINNCAITFGQLVASLVAGAFSADHYNGWRYMLGLAGVPAIIQFFAFMFMPESPRWLIKNGRYEDAMVALRKVRGSNANIEAEFEAIKTTCDEDNRDQEGKKSSVLKRVFTNPPLRKALIVGASLQAIQQLAGINTVMYYSATIIEMSGVKSKSRAIWLSSATSGMNCLCSFIGLLFVERIGRRLLTLVSLAGVCMSLTLLAVSFQIADLNSPTLAYKDPTSIGSACYNFDTCGECTENAHCGYCFTEFLNGTANGTCLQVDANDEEISLYGTCNTTDLPHDTVWASNWCPTSYSWITFMGLLLYLFFFAPGMGSMPWTINSEIYPLWARSTCYSIATSINWLCNFVISLTFLPLMQAITRYGAFYLYDAITIGGFVFLFLMLPETKGVSLEESENLFTHPWWKDATTSAEKKTVQYVHIRGINHTYAAEDSDDDS